MNEKEMKALNEEEIESVAGGRKGDMGDSVCDSCGQQLKFQSGGLPLTEGRHICTKCLKNVRDVIGPEAMSAWIRKNG